MSRTAVIEASPAGILEALRGTITDARVAYPEVLHLEIRDEGGSTWRFATQDAEWSPKDPAPLIGDAIVGASIDAGGSLKLELSRSEPVSVLPAARIASDDPPSWELITPAGLHLEFGPGLRWQFGSAGSAA